MSESTNETQVRTLIEDWARAVRAQDLDRILKHHAVDIVMFDVPLPVQLRGIEEYRESWNLFFSDMPQPVVFDLSELSVTAGDDVAFAHALLHCQEPGAEVLDLEIRLTIGLRKVDGQWTVVHEHHSEAAA